MTMRAFLPLLGCVVAIGSPASAQTVVKGAYSEAQAARGQAAYVTNCDRCHNADMQGAEFMAPAIGGRAFGAKWNGKSLGDAFDFISANMPLDGPGKLDARTVTDIIAYILKYSRYPSGTAELPADAKALAAIKVEPLP